ncbi:MAG: hypothetical protein FJ027_10670 [Candidatus Rokubacteria bacterium]|nr:hypothetical protein [Candidatus Rokubacteria bacterium]
MAVQSWWHRALASVATRLTAQPLPPPVGGCPNSLPVEVVLVRGMVRTPMPGAHVVAFLSPGGLEQLTATSPPGPLGRTVFRDRFVATTYAVYAWLDETDLESFVANDNSSPPRPVAVQQPVNLAQGDNPLVTLELKPIPRTIQVYLRLVYTDPEGNARPFPPGLRVTVEFAPADTLDATVGDDGALTFVAERRKREFTLKVTFGAAHYLVVEGRGVVPAKNELRDEAAAGNAMTAGDRAFSLPLAFDMQTCDWHVAGGQYANHKFTGLDTPAIEQGRPTAPILLTLNPHWLFCRFEFFDRYYGRSHHAARVSIPPIVLDGHRDAAAARDTRSNWTIGADAAHLLQCLPWILRRQDDTTPLAALSAASGLTFSTDQAQVSVVYSQDQNSREIRHLAANAAALQPAADRLRYYDLPRVWRSRRYYTRMVAGNKFFQDLIAGDFTNAESRLTPFTFCLDDIVLYTATSVSPPPGVIAPLAPALSPPVALDRVAIFGHTFDATVPDCSNQGVYKDLIARRVAGAVGMPYDPPGGHSGLPGSDVTVRDNYISDYADWTRLIACRGNLFDVFDRRAPDDPSPTRVVGARAAVRWVDATTAPAGVAAGVVFTPRPARVDSPQRFFSFQPFFEQQHPDRWNLYNGVRQGPIGRSDFALLRCCDVAAGNEVAMNLHYFRYYVRFSSPPFGVATEGQYIDHLMKNVSHRWTGRDVANPNATTFEPADPANAVRVKFAWFLQYLPIPQAHLNIDVISGAAGPRAWMNGESGTGELSWQYHSQNPILPSQPHRFSAAHESGHNYGLADEYGEKANEESYGVLGFRGNMPGDPYEDDFDAMMRTNQLLRNRHFWHAAEWVRSTPGLDFDWKVSHGAYTNYRILRRRDSPRSTHVTWPIAARANATHGAFGQFDIFLYQLGRDATSEVVIPGLLVAATRVDGILVVAPRIKVTTNVGGDATLRQMAAHFNAAIVQPATGFNNRWVFRGDVNVGSPPQPVSLRRCLIKLVPRFLISAAALPPHWVETGAIGPPGLPRDFHVRCDYDFTASPPPHPLLVRAWSSPPVAPQELRLDIGPGDLLGRTWQQQVLQEFRTLFRPMIGIGVGVAASEALLQPIARLLVPNAVVYSAALASPP